MHYRIWLMEAHEKSELIQLWQNIIGSFWLFVWLNFTVHKIHIRYWILVCSWVSHYNRNTERGSVTGAAIVARQDCTMADSWKWKLNDFSFKMKLKKKKKSLLKGKSSTGIKKNHKNCTVWSFSCEARAVRSLQKLYCIVLDGFLNRRLQSGQVILRIKNMSGFNVRSILC